MRPHSSSSRERGQIVPIAALLMIVIVGFAALIIDGGRGYVDRRDLQAAADTASLSGANQLGKHLIATNFNVGCAVSAAVQEVLTNLPGTSNGTYPFAGCSTLLGAQFHYAANNINLGNSYTMDISATIEQVQVTLHHNVGLTFGVSAGFGPSVNVAATATAVNGSIPFALVLFRNNTNGTGSTAPADLTMNGSSTVLSIKGTTSNPGSALSNEGVCPAPGTIDFSQSGGGNFYSFLTTFGAFPGSCGNSSSITGSGSPPNPLAFPIQLGDPGMPAPGPVIALPTGCTAQPCDYSVTSVPHGASPVCLPPGQYRSIKLLAGIYVLQPGGVYEVTGSSSGSASDFHVGGNAAVYTADQLPGGLPDPCSSAADSGASVIIDPTGSSGAGNQLIVDSGGIFDITAAAAQNHVAVYVRTPSGGPCSTTATGCGTQVVNFVSGASYNIKGLIYGYADNMTFSGATTGVNGVGQCFAWTININGNGTLDQTYDPSFLPFLQGLLK